MTDKKFIFACKWREFFYPIEKDNIELYYYSLYFNGSPVYRILDKRSNVYKSFDVYKNFNSWRISQNFSNRDFLDCSLFRHQLKNLIPPKYGWKINYYSDIMEKVMGQYHIKLRKVDKDFDWFNINYYEKLSKKSKSYIIYFIWTIKKYEIHIPLEIILMILGNIKNIEL